MRIEGLGLDIDFPAIEGYSDRQEWYANNLRKAYVENDMGFFKKIEHLVNTEADKRIACGEYDPSICLPSFGVEYTEPQKACLFGTDAGGIIATLKEALYGGNEH